MKSTNPTTSYLWQQYLAGKCTRAEMEALLLSLQQLQSSEEREKAIQLVEEHLQKQWNQPVVSDVLTPAPDWTNIWNKIDAQSRQRKSATRILYWSAAAVVILLVGLYWLQPAAKEKIGSVIVAKAPETLVIPAAQQIITLPDGSTVTLKKDARLLQQSFTATGRTVQLEGEAFFDVRHDAARPFRVKANGVTIRVLGTAFLVSAKPGETVQVKVSRGKVEVRYDTRLLGVLTPAQSIQFNKQTNIAALQTAIDTTGISLEPTITEWRWRDAKLDEVIAWLNEHFNVTITLTNTPNAQQPFTATFPVPVQLEDVLEVIGRLYHIAIKQTGANSYQLQPQS